MAFLKRKALLDCQCLKTCTRLAQEITRLTVDKGKKCTYHRNKRTNWKSSSTTTASSSTGLDEQISPGEKRPKRKRRKKYNLHLLHCLAKMQGCIQGRLIVNTILDGMFKRKRGQKMLRYLFGESHARLDEAGLPKK